MYLLGRCLWIGLSDRPNRGASFWPAWVLIGLAVFVAGFKIGLEVIARARADRIVEVPYTFRDRELGASKFGRREVGQYLVQLGQITRDKLLGRLR